MFKEMIVVENKIRVTLNINGTVADITEDIVDWSSLELLQERDDTSGVITTNSFPVQVTGNAMSMLKAEFEKDGLYSSATILIYERGDFNNEYSLIKSSPVDFSTYQEYDNYVSVELSESDLNDLINSEGKTDYDIPVAELMETKKWKYDRMAFVNIGDYEIATDTKFSVGDGTGNIMKYIYIPMTSTNVEVAPGVEVDFKGQSIGYDAGIDSQFKDYFTESLYERDVTLSVKLGDMSIQGAAVILRSGSDKPDLRLRLYSYKKNADNKDGDNISLIADNTISVSNYQESVLSAAFTFSVNVKATTYSVLLKKGECLCFVITINGSPLAFTDLKFWLTSFSGIDVSFKEASPNVRLIDVVNPLKLIQSYLDRMSGVKNKYKAQIQWDEGTNKIMIVAAESIRQLDNAQIHGSPNDFFDWMKVLGYEYGIDSNTLSFKKRDLFFQSSLTAMELEENDVSDLIIQADNTYAYTSVEIGYDKQDYDSINGRCEANGTFTYTTGYIAKSDNKLSLISPYRADAIGIELLCQETDKKTTDTDSDNDIFFVDLLEGTSNYTINGTTQVQDTEIGLEMFNGRLNPYYLVKRNESLIGINAKQLKFKSTDMSRNALIGNINPYQNVTVTKQLFKPVLYNFASGHNKDMPETNKNGIVKFNWHGNVLRGFIKSVRKNYVTEEETTWELWETN